MSLSELPRRKRAVAYLRQSTYREESISLELQEAACRAYAERQGYDVIAVESDPGISGRTWARPAVQRVMGMIESHEADAVILWRWSRLSRNRRDWAVAADRADLAGGTIESATEPNDATAAGRFARGVMTELAAFESERIGEQWKEAQARRRRLGLPASGGPRYGYDLTDGAYTPHETEAPILAEMYRRYLRGEGFSKIVAWLNRSDIQTKSGGNWSRVTVTHLLDSGFGAGWIIQRPPHGTGGEWNVRNSTFHPGAHLPLIEPGEWTQYLAKRMNAPLPSRTVEGRYLLTGVIVCDEHDCAMHVGNKGLQDYVCSRARQKRDVRGMVMNRALVEQRIREWVAEKAADIEAVTAEVVESVRQQNITPIDSAAKLQEKIDEAKANMGRITVRWSAGKMPDAAYEAAIDELDKTLAGLKARAAVASAREASTPIDPTPLILSLDQDWDDMTTDERRSILLPLLRQVRIRRPARQGAGVWRERVEIIPTWAPNR